METQEVAVKVKQPFAVQASAIALWIPILVLAIGMGANSAFQHNGNVQHDRMAVYGSMIMLVVNVVLLVVAFVMGIVALVGIWRLKLKGILGRTIVGMTLSGGFLLAGAFAIFYLPGLSDRVGARMVGAWDSRVPAAGDNMRVEMTLEADHRAILGFSGSAGTLRANGQWTAVFGKGGARSQLRIKFDADQDAKLGTGIMWEVEGIDENELRLVGKGKDGADTREVYRRVGK